MHKRDDQIEHLYQLLLNLQANCEQLVNLFNALALSADHEFDKLNKSSDFRIDAIKKGKIVTNEIGRA